MRLKILLAILTVHSLVSAGLYVYAEHYMEKPTATPSPPLWSTPKPDAGVSGIVLFDVYEMEGYDWDENGVIDDADRAAYLNQNGQFVTINRYAGMVMDRTSGE